MNSDGKPAPGEADWLALLSREMLLPEDIPEFERFNPNGNHRFWHLLLLAFRVVETDGKRTRFLHRADIYAKWHEHKEQSRQELRESLPCLKQTSKELSKALTALRRGRPGNVPPLINKARRQLGVFTRTHIATPLLAPPFTQERLQVAKALIEDQVRRIANEDKPSTPIPRRNHRDHAFRALVYLAAAYQLSGRDIAVDPHSTSLDNFPALISLFHRVATENLPTELLPENAEGFLIMARDRRHALLAEVGRLTPP